MAKMLFFVAVGSFVILTAGYGWARAFEVGAPVVAENPTMIHALFACIIVQGMFVVYSGIAEYRWFRRILKGGKDSPLIMGLSPN